MVEFEVVSNLALGEVELNQVGMLENSEQDREQQEVVMCAGLPMAGWRKLDTSERRFLLRRLILKGGCSLLWLAGVPALFSLVVVIGVLAGLISSELWLPDSIFSLILLVFAFFGLPVTILKARDSFRQAIALGATIREGRVRLFRGAPDGKNWTDQTAQVFKQYGIADSSAVSEIRVELLSSDDVVYSVNGRRLQKWIRASLTLAPAGPLSPRRFTVPANWLAHDFERRPERRRLSTGEHEEILQYVRHTRRGSWIYLPLIMLLVSRGVVYLLSDLFHMSTSRGGIIGLTLAVIICAVVFYRIQRRADRLQRDAAEGWVVILGTQQEGIEIPQQGVSVPAGQAVAELEILPFSNTLWKIEGKPAGWRRWKR